MTEEELQQLRHDLRSPLVIVSGFAQLLATDADVDPALRREYAQRIAAAADDLQLLLDERLGPG